MKIACCTWALSGADVTVLDAIAAIGFDWIDLRPADFTAPASLERMQALPLHVSCMALSFGIPDSIRLDSANEDEVTEGLRHAAVGLTRAAQLGATTAYVVPEPDGDAAALSRYAKTLAALADRAAEYEIRICVEHFPGKALPTIAATLEYLRAIAHPNLYLLLDIGHAQMSNEDIPTAIANAGDRLGYVHLDDNDGQQDLHWALLDGVLTAAVLRDAFAALSTSGYEGTVSLELSPQLPDPRDALRRSWDVVQGVW